jgi:hypothetical protein
MPGPGCDQPAQSDETPINRRGTLRRLSGLLLGGVPALLVAAQSSAGCVRKGSRCRRDRDCCGRNVCDHRRCKRPTPEATFTLDSFSITPAAATLPADTDVVIAITNAGPILHNFSILALALDKDVPPGATRLVTINAAAGDYEYFCDIQDHKTLGMVGSLTLQ